MKLPRQIASLGVVMLALSLTGVVAYAAGSQKKDDGRPKDPHPMDEDQLYERGMELAKEGKFSDALMRFKRAYTLNSKDPDVLNMLAYTSRKIGNLEDAFKYYEQALGLRPKFPQAREYLGEAHIQAALLQVKVLQGYGKEGEKELNQLVAALRKAAETLDPEDMKAATPAGSDW